MFSILNWFEIVPSSNVTPNFKLFLYVVRSLIVNMNNEEKDENVWSEWLDFSQSNIIMSSVLDQTGVFKVHASMKILYIGSSKNLKRSLLELLTHPCIGKAKRFSYLATDNAEEVKDRLLRTYRDSHGGKLPGCMESE